MSDTDQPQEALAKIIMVRPVSRGFIQANYDMLQRMVVLGMGYLVFDAGIANRMMRSIEDANNPMECWALFAPDDEQPQLCGAITFFIATDLILGEKYMYIYSLHCSKKVEIEAWRNAFTEISAYARAKGCARICAKTQIDHVIDIAKDNGFAVGTYLERGV